VLIEWEVGITMDDGVVLRGDVFRQDDGATVPALMTLGAVIMPTRSKATSLSGTQTTACAA
jgi:predicted acyl esterase